MNNRKLSIIVISLILVTSVFAFVTYNQHAQNRNDQQNNEEPTVIENNQLTDIDRGYGREYKNFYPLNNTTFSRQIEFSERIGKPNDILGSSYGEIEFTGSPNLGLTPSAFLSKLSCTADTILLGTVRDKRASISEDETLIFTKYQFIISSILKNKSANPLKINDVTEFARPGGRIIFKGRQIRQDNLAYPSLQRNKMYILFLKYLPVNNGYIVASPEGDFAVENESFTKLSSLPIPQELDKNRNLQLLTNTLSQSILNSCNQ